MAAKGNDEEERKRKRKRGKEKGEGRPKKKRVCVYMREKRGGGNRMRCVKIERWTGREKRKRERGK
jgi:hypothetical protein